MKRRSLLVVEDDRDTQELIAHVLGKLGLELRVAGDGEEALAALSSSPPDLVILDLSLPKMSGREVALKIRTGPATRHISILILTAKGDVTDKVEGFRLGADDYVTKPFENLEFRARVEALLARSRRILSANPLTSLPGNPAIEEEATRRMLGGQRFGFGYLDIDHFKAFNDVYGFQKGDEAILFAARTLLESVEDRGTPEDFVGHIGGDDFVVITEASRARAVCERVASRFDEGVGAFHTEEDRNRGYIETKDRRGEMARFPLMSISIGMVTNDEIVIEHYAKLVGIASEMKGYVKRLQGRKGSVFAFNRRK